MNASAQHITSKQVHCPDCGSGRNVEAVIADLVENHTPELLKIIKEKYPFLDFKRGRVEGIDELLARYWGREGTYPGRYLLDAFIALKEECGLQTLCYALEQSSAHNKRSLAYVQQICRRVRADEARAAAQRIGMRIQKVEQLSAPAAIRTDEWYNDMRETWIEMGATPQAADERIAELRRKHQKEQQTIEQKGQDNGA